MTDETLNAILRRVITEPDVDLHRLVYADRLDELSLWVSWATYIRRGVLDPRVLITFDREPEWSVLPVGITPRWNRGFVCEIKCDSATFLKHADELLWHESQKTPLCTNCQGSGARWRDKSLGPPSVYCPRCNSRPTGVTRPCPPTAHPIRKVVLTRVNDDFYYEIGALASSRLGYRVGGGHSVADCLLMLWPGVEIHFTIATGTEVVTDDLEQIDA